MKLLLILLIIFAGFSAFRAQASLKVLQGKMILLDSQKSTDEWTDAQTIVASDAVKLYFKQAGEFVLLAIDAPAQPYLWADVYLATGGEIYNLHASAMLGERILRNGEFTDWDWWNNKSWSANAGRILNSQKERPYLKHLFIPVKRFLTMRQPY